MLNIADIIHDSEIYGPGKRTVIWFQGCSIRCPGCINEDLLSFKEKYLISVEDLVNKVKSNNVTLLGGEPLDQKDMNDFLLALKEKEIDVLLFTGYAWDSIAENLKNIIKNTCSIVVSGPYIKELRDDALYLRGSSNQEMHYFNNEYLPERQSYEVVLGKNIEVRGRVYKDIFDQIEGK